MGSNNSVHPSSNQIYYGGGEKITIGNSLLLLNGNRIPEEKKETVTSFDAIELLEVINSLPTEQKNLKTFCRISQEIYEEKIRIIKKLRDMADYLAKTHGDVLIADRVGTGVGIGAGVLTIGGLAAAPFTAGLSLGLTMFGMGSGILASVTSVGANLSGYFLSRNSLKNLTNDLEKHKMKMEKLVDLAADSPYLERAARFRLDLEKLGKMSESGFLKVFTTIQTLVQRVLEGENPVVDDTVDPDIKEFLKKLQIPFLPREALDMLAKMVTQILDQFRSARNAIKAFVNYLKKPELAKIAMVLTSLSSNARASAVAPEVASEISSAFKGTPLAMSKAARGAAAAFTTVFIVIDIIHMVRICQETGETPTVQQLRSMADQMENELRD